MSDPVPVEPTPAEPRPFAVRLSPASFWQRLGTVPSNPQRLGGPGELLVHADRIAIRARRERPLLPGAAIEYSIPRHSVLNVIVDGARLHFAEQGATTSWTVHARDKLEAREIAAALPATRSADFQETAESIADFSRRLDGLGGRVIATPTLLAINIAVFIAMAVVGAGVLQPRPLVHVGWGSNAVPFTMSGEWWRLVTSQFLHFGLAHLLLNMWVLAVNGPIAERLYGTVRFVALYLLAGVAGAAASAAWNPTVNSAGASGAIFGMIGAMLAFALRKDLKVPLQVLAAERNSALVFIALNVANGLGVPNIDNAAHLGGLVGGFLLGMAFARPIDAEARRLANPFHKFGLPASAACLVLAFAAWSVVPRSPAMATAQLARRDQLWMVANEPAALQAIASIVQQLTREAPNREALAGRIGREVLPFYAEAKRRLASQPPQQDPVLASDLQFMRRYSKARDAANLALVRWARSGVDADREHYRRLAAEVDEVVAARLREMRKIGDGAVAGRADSALPPSAGAKTGDGDAPRDWFSIEKRRADALERSIREAQRTARISKFEAAERFDQELRPIWEAVERRLDLESGQDRLSTLELVRERREHVGRNLTVIDVRGDNWRGIEGNDEAWARDLEWKRERQARRLEAARARITAGR